MSNTATDTFLFLLRGGIARETLSPEQMQKQIEKYMTYVADLRVKGHFLAGEPLDDAGKVLSGEGGRTITDGPFAESKEEVGGYFMVRARDLDEAVELSKGCPILANGGTIEVRPIARIPGHET